MLYQSWKIIIFKKEQDYYMSIMMTRMATFGLARCLWLLWLFLLWHTRKNITCDWLRKFFIILHIFFLFKMNLRLGENFKLLNQKLNIYFIQTCIILIFLVVTRHSMLLLLQLFVVVALSHIIIIIILHAFYLIMRSNFVNGMNVFWLDDLSFHKIHHVILL